MDVSIVVLTYNPSRKKLFQTIRSILLQDDVDYEIIISDDGSSEDYFYEMKQLFFEYGFFKYTFVKAKKNLGTVYNVYRGLNKATKKYVKLLSPGDLFYNETSLRKWCEFMDKKDIQVSFSIPIYYSFKNDYLTMIDTVTNPSTLEPYKLKKGFVVK